MTGRTYLFDTNAIIEAVRTGTWKGITGNLAVHTVATCAGECRMGDRLSSGYVIVGEPELSRLEAIHPVSDDDIAAVLLMDKSDALHQGELDLFAHALKDPCNELWLICSPDLASVRFAVAAGIGDRLISLEDANTDAGVKPTIGLRYNFTSAWLSAERMKATLGIR